MKVTFVHHSCFVVEMEDVVLIFDYFERQIHLFLCKP